MEADLATIREMPPDEVEWWLTLVENGQVSPPNDFNWLGLAQAAQTSAHDAMTIDAERLEWARVGARVYELLLRDGHDKAARFGAFLSQFALRSYVIVRLGPIPGDTLFDVASVIDSLRRHLPLEFEAAGQMVYRLQEAGAKQWGGMIDDLRVLRQTKNLLNATVLLHEQGYFQDAPDIARWFALREALP